MEDAVQIGRRRFLRDAALAALPLVGGSCAHWARTRSVRVSGCVCCNGRGLAGVSISDGLAVARTDGEGRFDFASDTGRRFVSVTVPAGYRIDRSYAPIRPGDTRVRFDLDRIGGGNDRHLFVALADPQTGSRADAERFLGETVPDVRAAVAAEGAVEMFGVAVGDLMFDDLSLFPEYQRGIDATGIPFFQVIGNHDFNVGGFGGRRMPRTFEERFGPTYYSFERGAVHYVVLNDIDWRGERYRGFIDPVQMAWLKRDLGFVERGRTVVVFAHIPALDSRHTRERCVGPEPDCCIVNRDELLSVLEPYRAHIISGHTHEAERLRLGGTTQHILGTACGAWWSGPICFDGTPNGYAIFEARGEELRWRHKSTGLSASHRMRLYRGPEVVANLWDWDERWQVRWFEDGTPKGAMERRLATDPLSEELYRGRSRPSRRPGVDPVPTGHLFFARPAPGALRVVVEATDPWGELHVATV